MGTFKIIRLESSSMKGTLVWGSELRPMSQCKESKPHGNVSLGSKCDDPSRHGCWITGFRRDFLHDTVAQIHIVRTGSSLSNSSFPRYMTPSSIWVRYDIGTKIHTFLCLEILELESHAVSLRSPSPYSLSLPKKIGYTTMRSSLFLPKFWDCLFYGEPSPSLMITIENCIRQRRFL